MSVRELAAIGPDWSHLWVPGDEVFTRRGVGTWTILRPIERQITFRVVVVELLIGGLRAVFCLQ